MRLVGYGGSHHAGGDLAGDRPKTGRGGLGGWRPWKHRRGLRVGRERQEADSLRARAHSSAFRGQPCGTAARRSSLPSHPRGEANGHLFRPRVPGGDLVKRAHDAGAKVIHQIHTVGQAREAAELGVDAIIAQGSEAGGQGMALGVGAMALLPQVADAVDPIPVLAAGGVADGRGLAAAVGLGAQGANVGTRFLASEEDSAEEGWKRAILQTESEDVVRFEAWEGIFPPAGGGAFVTVTLLRPPRSTLFPYTTLYRARAPSAPSTNAAASP